MATIYLKNDNLACTHIQLLTSNSYQYIGISDVPPNIKPKRLDLAFASAYFLPQNNVKPYSPSFGCDNFGLTVLMWFKYQKLSWTEKIQYSYQNGIWETILYPMKSIQFLELWPPVGD